MSYYTRFSGFLVTAPALLPEQRADLAVCLPPGSSWCVSEDGARLTPAALETRTGYWEEFQGIIDTYLNGWGRRLSGEIRWSGEQEGDTGALSVVRGRVRGVEDEKGELSVEGVRDILARLESGDPRLMREGSEILFSLPRPLPGVAKALLPLLEHREPATRQCAVEGLMDAWATTPAVITALTECLTDPHEWVRSAAAEALGNSGPAALPAALPAVPALERLRNDPSYGPRGRSQEALARLQGLNKQD